MYLVTFGPDEKETFRVMWDAVKRPKQGKDDVRTQAKILRKMSRISKPVEDILEVGCLCGRKTKLPDAIQLSNVRELNAAGGYFDIDSAERKLIEGRLDEFSPLDKFVLPLDEAMGKIIDAKDHPDFKALQAAIDAFEQKPAPEPQAGAIAS